ncbi:MAG: DUF697 domain-containing protein, partial [Candidatus Wallbacteria bacterium]|nr:DUF697 domain-containing protein [Candidatus Wallbacteria bacterium]
MVSGIRNIAYIFSLIALFLFTLFLVNQTTQLVTLCAAFSPALAKACLYVLLAIYLTGIFSVIWILREHPEIPSPPERGSEDYPRFLALLASHLSSNPLLNGIMIDPADEASVKLALDRLDERTAEIVKMEASTVFLVTAVSQNGVFDSLTVLTVQVRMIWKLAHAYRHRPGLKDMLCLYANVALSAFFSRQFEDLDTTEHIDPVITAVTAATVGEIPGLKAAGALLARSLLDGTANAFLTLRVGLIC